MVERTSRESEEVFRDWRTQYRELRRKRIYAPAPELIADPALREGISARALRWGDLEADPERTTVHFHFQSAPRFTFQTSGSQLHVSAVL